MPRSGIGLNELLGTNRSGCLPTVLHLRWGEVGDVRMEPGLQAAAVRDEVLARAVCARKHYVLRPFVENRLTAKATHASLQVCDHCFQSVKHLAFNPVAMMVDWCLTPELTRAAKRHRVE